MLKKTARPCVWWRIRIVVWQKFNEERMCGGLNAPYQKEKYSEGDWTHKHQKHWWSHPSAIGGPDIYAVAMNEVEVQPDTSSCKQQEKACLSSFHSGPMNLINAICDFVIAKKHITFSGPSATGAIKCVHEFTSCMIDMKMYDMGSLYKAKGEVTTCSRGIEAAAVKEHALHKNFCILRGFQKEAWHWTSWHPWNGKKNSLGEGWYKSTKGLVRCLREH